MDVATWVFPVASNCPDGCDGNNHPVHGICHFRMPADDHHIGHIRSCSEGYACFVSDRIVSSIGTLGYKRREIVAAYGKGTAFIDNEVADGAAVLCEQGDIRGSL